MAITITLKKSGSADKDLTSLVDAEGSQAELTQEIENELCRFVSQDVALELDNSDGWFTTNWAALDLEALYPDGYYLQISKNAAVVWEGDLDPRNVAFDLKRGRVSATFAHKLKRLDTVSASGVLRAGYRYGFFVGWVDSATDDNNKVATLTDASLGAATDQYLDHYFTAYCNVHNNDLGTNSGQWCIFRVTGNTSTTVTGTLLFPKPYDGGAGPGDFYLNSVSTGRAFWLAPLFVQVLGAGTILGIPTDKAPATLGTYAGDGLRLALSTGAVEACELTAIRDQTADVNVQALPVDDLTTTTGTSRSALVATPHYRGESIADLVGLLFDAAEAAGIDCGAANREVSAVEYAGAVDYADFSDKTILEALTELAAVANCVVFATPSKYYFLDRDTAKSGGGTKSLTGLLVDASSPAIWANHHPAVRVNGRDGKFYRIRGGSRIDQPLELTTDFIGSVGRLKEMALRLYEYFGARRKAISATVLDDGTAYKLWDKVSYDSVDYFVERVSEPLRSVEAGLLSTVQLDLVAVSGTAPAAGTRAGSVDTVDLDEPIAPLLVAYADAVPYYARTGGSPYSYSEYNGASYDYPIYFTHDDPTLDTWKILLWGVDSVDAAGTTRASAWLDPFTRAAPASAPTTGTAAGGGPAGARTYYVRITYAYTTGETARSAQATQAVASGDRLTVTAPTFPGGVGKVHVYAGTSTTDLRYQGTITSSAGTWTEPVGGLIVTGPQAPTQAVHRAIAFTNASGTLDYSLVVRGLSYAGMLSAFSDPVLTKV